MGHTHAGPLPWAWIAANGGSTFPQCAFDLWWQLRALGVPYPRWTCPWCGPRDDCTRVHLETECASFAGRCWCSGIRPEEAFCFPVDDEWFIAVLLVISGLS